MPVNVFIGDPRSGKTYEVASVVIMKALQQGRRVLSNIAGLNQAEYDRLIRLENPDIQTIGVIVSLNNEEPLKSDFWLTDNHINAERNERQIQRGDVVVLDEIWRFWSGFALNDTSKGKDDPLYRRPGSVLNFFRMHGHMAHPVSGYICEVYLITQDIADIHRSVKSIVNQTFKTTKLTAIGSTKRYRLDVYNKTTTRKPIISYQRSYDSKFYALYKSHSLKEEGGAAPVEDVIDKRGNILKSKIFIVALVFLILSAFAVKFLWGFFHPVPAVHLVKDNALITNRQITAAAKPVPIQNNINSKAEFRIVGKVKKSGLKYFVIQSQSGQFRYVFAPSIKDYGIDKQIIFDGVVANSWERFNADNSPSFPLPPR